MSTRINELTSLLYTLERKDNNFFEQLCDNLIAQVSQLLDVINKTSQDETSAINLIRKELEDFKSYANLQHEFNLYKDMESERIRNAVLAETSILLYENLNMEKQITSIGINTRDTIEAYKNNGGFDDYILNLPVERISAMKNFSKAVDNAMLPFKTQIDELNNKLEQKNTIISEQTKLQSVAHDTATCITDQLSSRLLTMSDIQNFACTLHEQITEKNSLVEQLQHELSIAQTNASWQRNIDTLQLGTVAGNNMEHYVIDIINSLYNNSITAYRVGSDGKSLDIRLKTIDNDIAGIEVKNNKDYAKPEEYRTFEQVSNKLFSDKGIFIFIFLQFTDSNKFTPIEIINCTNYYIVKSTIYRQDKLLIEAGVCNLITLVIQLYQQNKKSSPNELHYKEIDEYIIATDHVVTITDAISNRLIGLSQELDQMNKIMRGKCETIKNTRNIKRKFDKVKSNTVIPKHNLI